MLGLVDAAPLRQPEEAVNPDRHRLGVIDGGLGADDAQADAPRIGARGGEQRRPASAASATASSCARATAIRSTPRPSMYLAGATPRARASSARST